MARYATAITPAIAGLIESGNPADPHCAPIHPYRG
jgi:hypothetical protein